MTTYWEYAVLTRLSAGLDTKWYVNRVYQHAETDMPQEVTSAAKVLDDAEVINFGKVIFKGKIDINPNLERIKAGKSLKHPNDGAIFQNREGRVPRNKDRDYYREFVQEMKGVPFPGPLRVIIGKKGEVYFTGDHYQSFTRVR